MQSVRMVCNECFFYDCLSWLIWGGGVYQADWKTLPRLSDRLMQLGIIGDPICNLNKFLSIP